MVLTLAGKALLFSTLFDWQFIAKVATDYGFIAIFLQKRDADVCRP